MIVGTAGHIDHGKTALVRALTGIDADRLPEEKRRGITIDLGFAYKTLPSGDVLGFVDVPGHEKFIHNMLAGAAGVDTVLLIVAADDGVMPQTVEALNHAKAAGVPIVVAVNKIDKPDADPTKVRGQLTEYGLVPEEYGGDSMFVIVSGEVDVSVGDDAGGGARRLALLGPGEIVGEMSLMTGARRSATVTAVTAVTTLEVTKAAIEPILNAAPALVERFAAMLERRQAELDGLYGKGKWSLFGLTRHDLVMAMQAFFGRTI